LCRMRITRWRLYTEGMRLLQRLREVDLFAGPQQTRASDGSRVSNSQEVGRAVVRSPPPPRLSEGVREQGPVAVQVPVYKPKGHMKNINDVIRVKENELLQIKKEVYILKEAARMMMEPSDKADKAVETVLLPIAEAETVSSTGQAVDKKLWP
jgi:hypothetical protein